MPTVETIMSRDLLTIGLETPTEEARARAAERHVRHMLVTESGAVAGVACLCDLEGADKATPVSELMSTPVAEVTPTTPLSEAAKLMRDFEVGCLAVSVNGFPIGVVTRGDLYRAGYWAAATNAVELDDECDAFYDLGQGD